MQYNTEFVKTVLSFSKQNMEYFNRFILDIVEYFPNNFDEYNNVINQFESGKRKFLNRRYNDFIKKYKKLLGIFPKKDILSNLNFNIDSYKKILKHIKYINENINIRDKMMECINSLQNLKIDDFILTNEFPLTVVCSETIDGEYYSLSGMYTDGNCTQLFKKQDGFTTYYIIELLRANYIILYSKDNIRGLKKMDVYVKNFEFDPNTLPEYSKLYGKNSWQNIKNMDKRKNLTK